MTTSNKIDALLFDLDGTLVDTAADFVVVLNQLLVQNRFAPLEEEAIRNTVSNGARALTQLAFGGSEGEEQFEFYRQALLDKYMEIVGDHSTLFDGMPEVLDRCSTLNIPWGIITNKPRRFTEKLIQKLQLSEACSLILCADDVSNPKPHPESMHLAAQRLNIDLKKSVYVGDHERDIASGNAANMITVAAEYGYILNKSNIPNWHANYIIQHPNQLLQLFL